MSEPPRKHSPRTSASLSEAIGAKAARKLRARRRGRTGVWSGLGMMGLIGWSVVVPTLLGAGLGILLDRAHPGGRSWTLALLVCGLAVGCLNAGVWVMREEKSMDDDGGEDHDD